MGLITAFRIAAVVGLIVSTSCTAKKAVRNVSKVYIDCCNPGLDYEAKDMCKWANDNPGKRIYQGNIVYEMVWSNCKPGEEPWRMWE